MKIEAPIPSKKPAPSSHRNHGTKKEQYGGDSQAGAYEEDHVPSDNKNEIDAETESIAQEYVSTLSSRISASATDLFEYEMSLLENETHPELLNEIEEAIAIRNMKIEQATKRYQLEKEKIFRTFKALQEANLSELKVGLVDYLQSVEMDMLESFYKQSFLAIRKKLSSRPRNAPAVPKAIESDKAQQTAT